jgi:ADP-ribose pyrophosphatase
MNYEILNEKYVYDGFLKIKRAKIRHETFRGTEPMEITRESMERGDSVAISFLKRIPIHFFF